MTAVNVNEYKLCEFCSISRTIPKEGDVSIVYRENKGYRVETEATARLTFFVTARLSHLLYDIS